MAKDVHRDSEQEERRLTTCTFKTSCSQPVMILTGYARKGRDNGFEKGFLRFDKDPLRTSTTTLILKKGCCKARQYMSMQSPDYGATAPGAVIDKLDANSHSVVRNEPGQRLRIKCASSSATVTPTSTSCPPRENYAVYHTKMET